jgi:hypothetical protein
MSISLFDPIPLGLLAFGWLQPHLPSGTQFLGWYFLACQGLLGLFGALLVRETLSDVKWVSSRMEAAVVLAGGALMATMPFSFQRFIGHTALSSQWVILLSLWAFLAMREWRLVSWSLAAIAVVGLASGINPYLCLMSIVFPLTLTVIDAICRRLRPGEALVRLAVVLATFAAGQYLFGFAAGAEIDGRQFGYGIYSMNLLSIFDSNGLGTLWHVDIANGPGQGEGYMYLGLGVLLLIATSLVFAIFRAKERSPTWMVSAGIVVAVMFVLALSTTVMVGDQVITNFTRLPDPVMILISKYRASGRLFWVGAYLLVPISIALLFRTLPQRSVTFILAIAVLVQGIDIYRPASNVREITDGSRRLLGPSGLSVPMSVKELMVVPPWQCGPDASPGGLRGYELVGDIALNNKLVTNSFYAARTLPEQAAYHCNPKNWMPAASDLSHVMFAVGPAQYSAFLPQLSESHNCSKYEQDGGYAICTPKIP